MPSVNKIRHENIEYDIEDTLGRKERVTEIEGSITDNVSIDNSSMVITKNGGVRNIAIKVATPKISNYIVMSSAKPSAGTLRNGSYWFEIVE